MGVSLSAAVRERNLVPRSEDAFLAAAGAVAEDAWGMVAATFGSLERSAAFEGVSVDDGGAGSEALGAGVAGDGVGAECSLVAEASTRGSFCDFGDAGEDGERVAHAGSTLAVLGWSERETPPEEYEDGVEVNGASE